MSSTVNSPLGDELYYGHVCHEIVLIVTGQVEGLPVCPSVHRLATLVNDIAFRH